MTQRAATATVILPSLDGARTRETLRSLAAQSALHEAIVVDNASPGRAVSVACEEFEFARAIEPGENLGFSRAVNVAAAEATGDALVLVNDDARYDPDFVERLVAALEPDAGVVAAAGVLRSERDESRIDTAGVEIDRTLLGFDYLHGRPLDVLADGMPDPFGPTGAAAAYDRQAFAQLGGFDERIFAYFEDVDLALRTRVAGLSCRLAPAARGTHAHATTLGSGSPRKNYLMGFARGYLLRKWGVVSARRAPGIAVREFVICSGQALVDRNLAGIRGRREGWRAAREGEYPAVVVETGATLGLVDSLARRAGRLANRRAG
jgi:N-acetylglucosaminyl-diphospho-decaprenol L-rhamnosyltransferase